MYQTHEVFGVSNEMIATYVERHDVDDLFVKGLEKNKHLVIYGASKQGKTALTAKHLKENDYIKVNCSPSSTIQDLYNSIVRQLEIEIVESKEVTQEVGGETKVGIRAKVKLPYFGSGEAGMEGKRTTKKGDKLAFKIIDFNLFLAQDLSELLRAIEFEKKIIIENFHYLTEENQKLLAIDLRIFDDYKMQFIILGIWREKNRLIQFNGDLVDRLIEIPVEPWEKTQLEEIVNKGLPLLNVSFEDVFEKLVETCFDSVGVFQELCKESCYAAGVKQTTEGTVYITHENIQQAIDKKLGDYSSRHIRCLEAFVEQKAKSSDEIPLYIPYYFIKTLFKKDFEDITVGLKRRIIQENIKAIHHRPDDVRPSDMGYFLQTLVSNQIKKSISPPIFDYDIGTSSVKIIDSTFYFFLKNCDNNEILEYLPVPVGL
jgi:Cdc6-like AAA superfamily ATPase